MDYEKNYYDYINFVFKQNRKKLSNKDINYKYYEKHHVLPKSIFPEYEKLPENLVLLTAREHFLAHYLLTKIYKNGQNHKKMIYAFNRITHKQAKKCINRKVYINSRLYEKSKIEFSEIMRNKMTGREVTDHFRKAVGNSKKGNNNKSHKMKGLNHWNTGTKRSEESKRKMSEKARDRESNRKGKHHSEETLKKISQTSKGRFQSEETRKKRSVSLKGKTLGYKRSNEAIEKMRYSALHRNYKNKRKFQCIETGDIFQNQIEASKLLNIPKHIKLCLDNPNKTCGGYHFRWI